MSKLLKIRAVGLPERKTNREENLTEHVGCAYAKKAKKIKKNCLMIENVATSRKSKNYNRQ